ncbi:uncharacterized protein LOC113510707 [Galleria mellonella]|uniref:Uncharacterized protein LOC113510707 n=1 Tax=Galleria mellonella TaxID=7137 RepID=A0A6J1WGR1_GALME|nr:uncharacterized protein LOC113510707 [Galleria mellonella]
MNCRYYTEMTLGWMLNNKMIVFLGVLAFCLFVSLLAMVGQRNRAYRELEDLKEQLNNKEVTSTPTEESTTDANSESTTDTNVESTTDTNVESTTDTNVESTTDTNVDSTSTTLKEGEPTNVINNKINEFSEVKTSIVPESLHNNIKNNTFRNKLLKLMQYIN